jgi:hypothetical protein
MIIRSTKQFIQQESTCWKHGKVGEIQSFEALGAMLVKAENFWDFTPLSSGK